jgi:hypothetical protein
VAIYEGARPLGGILFPRPAALPAPALPRRRRRSAVRARRHASRVGLVLGGIVLTFLLAFFSLAQSVRVSATGYDLERLSAEQGQLEGQRQQLISDLNRLGREPAIRKKAFDGGLAPLGRPLVVPAR